MRTKKPFNYLYETPDTRELRDTEYLYAAFLLAESNTLVYSESSVLPEGYLIPEGLTRVSVHHDVYKEICILGDARYDAVMAALLRGEARIVR